MRFDDIEVGQEYEVKSGDRLYKATVISKDRKKSRIVHSNQRWDFGHSHTGPAIEVQVEDAARAEWMVPQNIRRPWAEALPEVEAAEAKSARQKARIGALNRFGLESRWEYRSFAKNPHSDTRVTVEAEVLEALLQELEELRRDVTYEGELEDERENRLASVHDGPHSRDKEASQWSE